MRPLAFGLGSLLLLLSVAQGDVVAHYDFETTDPVEAWSEGMDCTVISKGLSDEQAHGGRQSLKLQVEMKSGPKGGVHYYWLMPMKPSRPIAGNNFRIRGHILVRAIEHTKVGLGMSYSGANIEWAGLVGQATEGWQQFTLDSSRVLLKKPDARFEGAFLGFIGPGKATVYLDDVIIETGELAPDIAARLAADEQLRQRLATRLTERFQRAALAATKLKLPVRLPGPRQAHQQRLQDLLRQSVDELRQTVVGWQQQVPSHLALVQTRGLVDHTEYALAALRALGGRVVGDDRCLPYVVSPIRNDLPNPDSFPLPGAPAAEINLVACRGEYEPTALALYALADLHGVTVQASPLTGKGGRIAAEEVDVRLVKSWYQSPAQLGLTLRPELLLRDDAFVTVDTTNRTNVMGNAEAPRDAPKLRPFAVPAGTCRTLWITAHVPAKAQPGSYRGSLTIRAGAGALSMPLSLRVPKFDLLPPRPEYAIYYRGRPAQEQPGLTGDALNATQFRAELIDLREHGVTNPWMYGYPARDEAGKLDWSPVRRALQIRREVGLLAEPIVFVGNSVGIAAIVDAKTPERRQEVLANIRAMTRQYRQLVEQAGFKTFAVYGVDEAPADVLAAQAAAFAVVHEEGGLICGANVGPDIDLAATSPSFETIPEQLKQAHAHGGHLYVYSDPYGWDEEPYTWRLHYGLRVWMLGVDGAADYAYRHTNGSAYNEGVRGGRRQMALTYPTVDGVIDTVQWEGFREGVDDVRYVSTLLAAIAAARQDPKRAPQAEAAQRWLDDMARRLREEHLSGDKQPFTGSCLRPYAEAADLQGLRLQVMDWIERLL